MATSLAKQLLNLKVPQAQLLSTKDQAKISLLFQPNEAANLDKETIYSLGINGLQELQIIDSSLATFEDNLFGTVFKDKERSIETLEFNKELNKTIKKFLISISPYFLLKPSLQTLEWLVHRFHINTFNINEILLLILPYHETNYFMRTLQCMKINANSKWAWLNKFKETNIVPLKKDLMRQILSDLVFLKFICKLPLEFIKVFGTFNNRIKLPLNFYTSLICLSFNAPYIDPQFINIISYYIEVGLKSRCRYYQLSSIIILNEISSTLKLSGSYWNKFIDIISEIVDEENYDIFLILLTNITNNQILEEPFEQRVLEGIYLTRKDRFVAFLNNYAAKFECSSLICLIGKLLIKNYMIQIKFNTNLKATKRYQKGLKYFINTIKFSTPVQEKIIRFYLTECIELLCLKEPLVGPSVIKQIGKILNILDRSYPSATELAFNTVLNEKNTFNKSKSAILDSNDQLNLANVVEDVTKIPEAQNMLVKMIASPKFMVMEESNDTLFMSLNHPSSKIRIIALEATKRKLQDIYDGYLQNGIINAKEDDFLNFVRQTIQLKLQTEDEVKVLAKVFDLLKLKFIQILYPSTLDHESMTAYENVEPITLQLSKFLLNPLHCNNFSDESKNWYKLIKKALILISELWDGDSTKEMPIIPAILPHLIVIGKVNLYTVRRFTRTKLFLEASIFASLRKCEWAEMLSNKYKITEANEAFLKSIIQELKSPQNIIVMKSLLEKATWIIGKMGNDEKCLLNPDKRNNPSFVERIILLLINEIIQPSTITTKFDNICHDVMAHSFPIYINAIMNYLSAEPHPSKDNISRVNGFEKLFVANEESSDFNLFTSHLTQLINLTAQMGSKTTEGDGLDIENHLMSDYHLVLACFISASQTLAMEYNHSLTHHLQVQTSGVVGQEISDVYNRLLLNPKTYYKHNFCFQQLSQLFKFCIMKCFLQNMYSMRQRNSKKAFKDDGDGEKTNPVIWNKIITEIIKFMQSSNEDTENLPFDAFSQFITHFTIHNHLEQNCGGKTLTNDNNVTKNTHQLIYESFVNSLFMKIHDPTGIKVFANHNYPLRPLNHNDPYLEYIAFNLISHIVEASSRSQCDIISVAKSIIKLESGPSETSSNENISTPFEAIWTLLILKDMSSLSSNSQTINLHLSNLVTHYVLPRSIELILILTKFAISKSSSKNIRETDLGMIKFQLSHIHRHLYIYFKFILSNLNCFEAADLQSDRDKLLNSILNDIIQPIFKTINMSSFDTSADLLKLRNEMCRAIVCDYPDHIFQTSQGTDVRASEMEKQLFQVIYDYSTLNNAPPISSLSSQEPIKQNNLINSKLSDLLTLNPYLIQDTLHPLITDTFLNLLPNHVPSNKIRKTLLRNLKLHLKARKSKSMIKKSLPANDVTGSGDISFVSLDETLPLANVLPAASPKESLNQIIKFIEFMNVGSVLLQKVDEEILIRYLDTCLPLFFIIVDCCYDACDTKSLIDREGADELTNQLLYLSNITLNLILTSFERIGRDIELSKLSTSHKDLDKIIEIARTHVNVDTLLKILSKNFLVNKEKLEITPKAINIDKTVKSLAINILSLCVPILNDDTLLHHVISLFTFMRPVASLIHLSQEGKLISEEDKDKYKTDTFDIMRDDETTFELIYLVIERLIPPIVEKSFKQLDEEAYENSLNVDLVIIQYLLIFCDAATHLPSHRRIPFYKHLIEVLTATKFKLSHNYHRSSSNLSHGESKSSESVDEENVNKSLKKCLKSIILNFVVVLFTTHIKKESETWNLIQTLAKSMICSTNFNISISQRYLKSHLHLPAALVETTREEDNWCSLKHFIIHVETNEYVLSLVELFQYILRYLSFNLREMGHKSNKITNLLNLHTLFKQVVFEGDQSNLSQGQLIIIHSLNKHLSQFLETYLKANLFNFKNVKVNENEDQKECAMFNLSETLLIVSSLISSCMPNLKYTSIEKGILSNVKIKDKALNKLFKCLIDIKLTLWNVIKDISDLSINETNTSDTNLPLSSSSSSLLYDNIMPFKNNIDGMYKRIDTALSYYSNKSCLPNIIIMANTLMGSTKSDVHHFMQMNLSECFTSISSDPSQATNNLACHFRTSLHLTKIGMEILNQYLVAYYKRDLTDLNEGLAVNLHRSMDELLHYIASILEWFYENVNLIYSQHPESSFLVDAFVISPDQKSPEKTSRSRVSKKFKSKPQSIHPTSLDLKNIKLSAMKDEILNMIQFAITCYKQILPLTLYQTNHHSLPSNIEEFNLPLNKVTLALTKFFACEIVFEDIKKFSSNVSQPQNDMKSSPATVLPPKLKLILSLLIAVSETYNCFQFDPLILSVAGKAVKYTLDIFNSTLLSIQTFWTAALSSNLIDGLFNKQMSLIYQCVLSCLTKYMMPGRLITAGSNITPQTPKMNTSNFVFMSYTNETLRMVLKLYYYLERTRRQNIELFKLNQNDRLLSKLTEFISLFTLKGPLEVTGCIEQLTQCYRDLTSEICKISLESALIPVLDGEEKVILAEIYFTTIHEYFKKNVKFQLVFGASKKRKKQLKKGEFGDSGNPEFDNLKRIIQNSFINVWMNASTDYAKTFDNALKINRIVIKTLMAFCVKLSEINMRPFLLQLKENIISTVFVPHPSIENQPEGDNEMEVVQPPNRHESLKIKNHFRMAFYLEFVLALADELNLLFIIFFDILYEPIAEIIKIKASCEEDMFLIEKALKIISLALKYSNEVKGMAENPDKTASLTEILGLNSADSSSTTINLENQLELMTTEKYETICSILLKMLEHSVISSSKKKFIPNSSQQEIIIQILADLNKLHAVESDWRIFNDLLLNLAQNNDPKVWLNLIDPKIN